MVIQDYYEGKAFDAYTYFGAHIEYEGGVTFRTYAPNARAIELIGEFNGWNGFYMTKEGTSGVFSAYIRDASAGQMYKYRIHGGDGSVVDKSDPYGFRMELRPNAASYIVDMRAFEFTDGEWMRNRQKNYDLPMNIYEIHMGSWKMKHDEPQGDEDEPLPVEERWLSYREIAEPLISYLKTHGYTHVEVMPLSEHPADCSWGYQVTGFFSPTSRYGTPDDLKYFVNECHNAGIGVITDFVPVHFAVDGYSLAKYDGTALYEYPNTGAGASEWGTYNFNYFRGESRCFMQSAANYWLSEYHFDGIRMDAISNIIYWQGDAKRGINNGAVNFIRSMNSGLHHLHPTAILMAEDSTNYIKVTAPVEYDGLGFDYKWDMGWMNDTLDFFRTPPEERSRHYNKITFSMQYFYNELYLLPISHDENVHGKATVIQKMWGDYDVKFPQCRAFYAYMYTHPGKKLNFMGSEFAQFREWDETREQDWEMLKYPRHDSFSRFVSDLSALYKSNPALYDGEYNSECFRWLEADAAEDCIYIYERMADCRKILVVLNLSDKGYENYTVGVDGEEIFTEILYSDSDIYSGNTPTKAVLPIKSERAPHKRHNWSFKDTFAPFSAKIYSVEKA
ncbi:MAG: 1,4-alpha-glucan branching protein GlgB [Oscillospiraceae bacterium]|nr:1,4-alpha-glucan branching protein GlgB [Oscillospiraceae bacterium]